MKIKKRKQTRLKNYDYTQAGAYFVTVCVQDKKCLFGEIVDRKMILNKMGNMVQFTWDELTCHNINIVLDQFVVMPDHIHGIIIIQNNVGAGSKPARNKRIARNDRDVQTVHGLSEIVRQFKTFSAMRINKILNKPGGAVWQRNYYDHIIRDDMDLNRIRQYIRDNPSKGENGFDILM